MGTFALLVLMSWSLGLVVRSSAINYKTPSEESSEKTRTLHLTTGEAQPAWVVDSETSSTRADDAQQQSTPQVGQAFFIVQYPGDPRFFLATTATLFAGGQPLLQGIVNTGAATAQAFAGDVTTTAEPFRFWPFVNQPQPPPVTFPLGSFVSLLNLLNQPNVQVPGVVSPVQPCPQVCTAGGVGTSTLDQMVNACAASCRTAAFENPENQNRPADRDRGSCLVACFRATRESCSTACGLLTTAANQALCATACAQLCPAAVTPTPLLSDPRCCVQPAPICGAKGTFATQVLNCETNCANTFVGTLLAPDLPGCQQACSVFPSQACKATCNLRFPNQPQRTNCETACNRLCVLEADTVNLTAGIHVSGRAYCRAIDLDTCGQVTGSTAFGLNLITQKTNCETRCSDASFLTPANRNICSRACTVQPQSNCVIACSAIGTVPADAADLAACNSACRSLCIV